MRVSASNKEGLLKIVIGTNDSIEGWFLRQLMEHGASATLESGGSWAHITLTGRSLEEAELAAIDEQLGCRP